MFPLVELPIREITHVRRMSIVYRKDGYLSPAARRLIAILKAQAKEIDREGVARTQRSEAPDTARSSSSARP
jgi:hypothetical protein